MRQAQRRAARNQSARSAVRTYFKKASVAVASSSDDAAAIVVEAVSALDKAAQRGIIHRNAAARRKSRLMGRLHQISLAKASAETAAKPETKPTRGRTAAKSAASGDKKPAARKPAARKAPSKKS
jgi:small subunit ribosomal protein S20